MKKFLVSILFTFSLGLSSAVCQNHQDQNDENKTHTEHNEDHSACGFHHDPAPGSEYDSKGTSFHHIADANVYSIGPLQIPLPVIAFAPGHGWDFFMSSKFHFETIGHGDGHQAHNQYVLHGGSIKRVADPSFPTRDVKIEGFKVKHEMVDGKEVNISYLCY